MCLVFTHRKPPTPDRQPFDVFDAFSARQPQYDVGTVVRLQRRRFPAEKKRKIGDDSVKKMIYA